MSSQPIVITGYPDKPQPRTHPPTTFSCLHTVATRILPLLLTIHFCITSAVVLVYALALRRALPVRFVVGVTITFAVLIASFVLGNCAVWCRRRERQRERQRRVVHGGATTQNTDDTTAGSTKSCDPGLVVEEEDREDVCWRVWMGWLFPCTKKESREESASDCPDGMVESSRVVGGCVYDGGPAVEAQGQRRELHQYQHQLQQKRNEVVAPATARSHLGTNGYGDTHSGHPFASGGLQDPEPEQQQQQQQHRHLNAIYLNSRGSRDSHVSELEANELHHEYHDQQQQQRQGNGSSALSLQPNDDSRSAAPQPPGPRESARSRSADAHYFTRPVSQHALLVAHPGPGDIGRIALREEGEGREDGVKIDGRGNGGVVCGLAMREREPVRDLARMEEERGEVRLLRQRQKRKEKQRRKRNQEEDGVEPEPDTLNPCQDREQRGGEEGEGGTWKPMQRGKDSKLKPLWLPGEVARHSRLLSDSRDEQHGISIPIPILAPIPTSRRDPRPECGSESRPGPDARQAQPTQPDPQHLLPLPAPPPPVRGYAPPQASVSSVAGLSAAVQRPAEGQYRAFLGDTGCGSGSGSGFGYGGYELGWEFGVGMNGQRQEAGPCGDGDEFPTANG
ncbi:uncharacterized protein L3040_002734 [Drepanopeziza brunnea f. sp. 'multigermtubi']|uniref:uncharacterized protein n=1 Tax=Drepanopeziza brunnea f. sp. 'multigermtubi' TaxID=698441 RepID=UPI00239D6019|nr:hypothetical protein L3040_002734 [Drepanopeziza brunnea f. sp. 'multigermtubi']